jgi:DDE_Tnp_1-associated
VSVCQESSALSTMADQEQERDISSLPEMVETVPDPRSTQGRTYQLSFVLAVSVVAVLAGAANFRQICDQVADLPQSLLRKLDGRWCYFRCLLAWPSERTIRRVLENIDAAKLDQAVGGWLLTRARRGEDSVWAVAINGTVLTGAWTDAHDQSVGLLTLTG